MMYLDNIIDNPMDLNELKKLLNFENIKNKAWTICSFYWLVCKLVFQQSRYWKTNQ